MKLLVSLVLFSLCFHSLALDFDFVKGITSEIKRDSLFSSDCTDAAVKMRNDVEFGRLEDERSCNDPKADSVNGLKYTVKCPTTQKWAEACKRAGGEVCVINVSLLSKLSSSSPQQATFLVEANSCVPKPCKKGDNINEFKNHFVNVVCPLNGATNCKMNFTCKSNAGFVAGMIFLSLAIITMIGAAGFLIYKRYFSHYSLTSGGLTSTAPFAEYSELAQYEQEDEAFISDTSGIDGQEEEHNIN